LLFDLFADVKEDNSNESDEGNDKSSNSNRSRMLKEGTSK
jgi:hypothetical protein